MAGKPKPKPLRGKTPEGFRKTLRWPLNPEPMVGAHGVHVDIEFRRVYT